MTIFQIIVSQNKMTGGSDSTANIRTSEIKLQEVRKDLV